MNSIFKISEVAIKQLKQIREEQNIGEEYLLRIGVRTSSACGGVSYVIGFDKQDEGDQTFGSEAGDVLIEKRHVMFLAGLTVDYVDEDERQGFTFMTPQQKKAK